jgi:hypothetical protein
MWRHACRRRLPLLLVLLQQRQGQLQRRLLLDLHPQ